MIEASTLTKLPISSPAGFLRIGQEEFNRRAYDLMSLVFHVHNDLGPDFYCEDIYRNAIAIEARKKGHEAAIEVPLRLTFGTYTKEYFVDLLIDGSLLFEIKTAEAIHIAHRTQTLTYLLLAGLAHGKIVNMRGPSVQHEFVSTSITPADRFNFSISDDGWEDTSEQVRRLRELIIDLIREWGTFLPVPLYYDAIEHFFGGHEQIVGRTSVNHGEHQIGSQPAHQVDRDSTFRITALTNNPIDYKRRLRRYLRHTSLESIHWINFNHAHVDFYSIRRE